MPEREIFDSVANETTVINIPDMYANTDEDTLWYVNNVYSPYRDSGMEAASQDPDHPLSGIPDAFARGFYRLGQGANALQVQLGLDNPENAAKEIQQYQKYIEQVPYDKEVLDSLNNIVEAESIGEIWDEVTTLPGLRAVGNVVGESLAQFTPAFAAMLAALPFTASAVALGAIAGLGSLSVEVQGTLLEEMQKYLNENNEDISDDKAVANLLGDEERMAEFSIQAAKRGIPIGLIDGLSVGFAGKIAASLSNSRRSANKALEAARKKEAKASKVKLEDMPEITPKSKIPERLAFAAEALALQPAAGGLGEAVAQQVAGEGFQLGPVALEFIAEIPGGTAETGIGMALANRRENKIIELEETQKKLHSKALNERKKAKANQQLAIVEEDIAGARDENDIRYIESYEDALYNTTENIKEGEVAFTRGSIKKLFGLKSAKAVDAVINYFVNRGTVVKSKGKYNWTKKARSQRQRFNQTQVDRTTGKQKRIFNDWLQNQGGRYVPPVPPVTLEPTEITEEVTQAQLEEAPVTPVKTTEDVGPITPDDFKATEVEEAVVEEAPTPTPEVEPTTVDTTEVDTQLSDIQNREIRLRNRLNQLAKGEVTIENEEAIIETEARLADIATEREQAQSKKAELEASMFRPKTAVDEPPEEIVTEVSEEFKSFTPTDEVQDVTIIKDIEDTIDKDANIIVEADTNFDNIKGINPSGKLEVNESTLNNQTKEMVNEFMNAIPKREKKDKKPFTIREGTPDQGYGPEQNVELIKALQGAMNTGTYLDLNATEQERLRNMFKDEEEFVDRIIIDVAAATTPAERKRIAKLVQQRYDNLGTGATGRLYKTLGALHGAFYKVYHPMRIGDLHPIYKPFSRTILKRRQKRQLYDSAGFKIIEGFMKNTSPEQVRNISAVSLVLDALYSNEKKSILNKNNVKETDDGGLEVTIPTKLPKDSKITKENFNIILESLNKGTVDVKPGATLTLTPEEYSKFKETQQAFQTMFDIVSRAYARFNLQRYKLYDGIEQNFNDTHETLHTKVVESAARFIEDVNKLLPEGKKIKEVSGQRDLRQKLTNMRSDSPLLQELVDADKALPKDLSKLDGEKYKRALAQARTLVMMNQQRRIIKDHPYYIPRLRYGKYYFTVYEKDNPQNVVGYYASNPAAFDISDKAEKKRLVELREEIAKDYDADKYMVTGVKTRQESAKKLLDQPTLSTVQRLGEMIGYKEEFKNKQGRVYEFFERMEDLINTTGFGRYMAQRGENVIVGYATPNNIDNFLPIALSNYIRSAADTASNLEFTRPLTQSIKFMRDKDEHVLADLADKQLDDINEEGEPGALFKTIAFHYALGANFSSAMVNLSQPFVTTIPLLTAMSGSPSGATKEVLRGLKDAVKLIRIKDRLDTYGFKFDSTTPPHKGLTQDEWDLLRYFARKGDIQANVNLDLGARYQQALGEVLEGKRATENLAKGMEKLMDASAFMFGGVEQINRIATALAAYRLATKSDKNLRNFQKFSEVSFFHEGKMTPELAAEMMVYNTQFMIGKENRPELFRSGLMNVATQFMSFPLQYFGLWAKAMRVAGVDKKMGSVMMGSMLMAMMAFGGMMGLPFAENLRQLLSMASRAVNKEDYDLEYGLREAMLGYMHPELVEVILRGGLSRATGIDVSRRMGAGEIIPYTLMQGDLMAATGPFGGLFVDTAKRMYEAVKLGDYPMLVTSVLPLGPRYAVEAATGLVGDPKPIRTTQGRVILPADQVEGLDRFKQALGFTPENVSTARRQKRLLNFWKNQSRNLQDYYLSNLAKLHSEMYRTQDAGELQSINQEISELLAEVQAINEEALAASEPQRVINLTVKSLRERVATEIQGQIPRLQRKMRKLGPLITERLDEMVPR